MLATVLAPGKGWRPGRLPSGSDMSEQHLAKRLGHDDDVRRNGRGSRNILAQAESFNLVGLSILFRPLGRGLLIP